jgi:hypothetical protein
MATAKPTLQSASTRWGAAVLDRDFLKCGPKGEAVTFYHAPLSHELLTSFTRATWVRPSPLCLCSPYASIQAVSASKLQKLQIWKLTGLIEAGQI